MQNKQKCQKTAPMVTPEAEKATDGCDVKVWFQLEIILCIWRSLAFKWTFQCWKC